MTNAKLSNEQLLAEVEDLLRTMPPTSSMREATDTNFAWIGRAAAVLELWDSIKSILFMRAVSSFNQISPHGSNVGFREMMTLLNQARHDLRMRTLGPVSVAISQGRIFDYFDEVRKIIELATQDLFVVDPYLDAQFVSRYLPHVRQGVPVRLLTSKATLNNLLSAVDLFVTQNGVKVSVRCAKEMHDRYVFVDRRNCYQSGASLKDGGRQAPTTLTQITDAFDPVYKMYESLWLSATIELG